MVYLCFTVVVNVYVNRVPTVATALLLIFAEKSLNTIDLSLIYGEAQVSASRRLCLIQGSELAENCTEACTCLFGQIICTTVVVAFSILLGGGSLVCLSRENWARNDQIQNGKSTDDIVDDMEQETLPPIEPNGTPSGSLSRGNFTGAAGVLV